MNGGGTAGAVDFPTYLKDIQANWLTGAAHSGSSGGYGGAIVLPVEDAMNVALGTSGNPYTGETAYDPSTVLDSTDSRFSTADSTVTALSPVTDWQSFYDTAKAKVDAGLLSEAEISALVAAYENNQLPRHLRAVSRFAGTMADMNAVIGSQFAGGLALLEVDFMRDVNQYEQNVRLKLFDARVALVTNAVNEMEKALFSKVQFQLTAAQLKSEINRIRMAAKKEQADGDLEIDIHDATWDLSVYQYGAQMMAAISGAGSAGTSPRMTKTQSALSGAFAGASLLSALGNPFLIGAGALVGGVAAYFTS